MSYCRWSSMGGRCDVYAYEDYYGGYTIHLAARKRKNLDKAPELPELTSENIEEYLKATKKLYEWHDTEEGSVFYDLNLEHAGQSFHEKTLEDFHGRMLYLRDIGYVFPDYVLETIEEEMKDEQA